MCGPHVVPPGVSRFLFAAAMDNVQNGAPDGIALVNLVPGLILSAVFIAYIVTVGWLKPELAPSDGGAALPEGDRRRDTVVIESRSV